MRKVKQVIVMRNDLRNTDGDLIGAGKIAAMVAHGSLGAYIDLFKHRPNNAHRIVSEWEETGSTKIVLECNTVDELLGLYSYALQYNLPLSMITDNGLTEFGGVKTTTSLGIGPYYAEEIDKVTGYLKRFK